MIEFDVCDDCANALEVSIEAAEIFGPAPPEVFKALCPPCAERGLAAIEAA